LTAGQADLAYNWQSAKQHSSCCFPSAAGLSRDRNIFSKPEWLGYSFPSRSDSATVFQAGATRLQFSEPERLGYSFPSRSDSATVFRAGATQLQLAICKTTFILLFPICSRSQQRPEHFFYRIFNRTFYDSWQWIIINVVLW